MYLNDRNVADGEKLYMYILYRIEFKNMNQLIFKTGMGFT